LLVFGLIFIYDAQAQWSSDPAVNLSLGEGPGDQVQPKVKPLPDGSWYVSWFSNNPNDPPPSGYDVHLQRLDPDGVEQFPHNGILIADLGNSSTQDYGLDADAEQNALLAFLDTREGPTQQVTAAKMSPCGEQLWGKLGVQLTDDTTFHGNPKIAATSDGNIVVAWISDSSTVLQKLDPDGQPLWGSGVVLSETGANYSLADLKAAEDGSVIVSWIRDTGFSSDRWMLATKLDANGQYVWDAGSVRVFDGGSLQLGAFPYFITDGNGGALFAWYSSRPSFQVFAQHISSDGQELFPHNGAVGSMDATRARISPSVSYRADTGETFLFWTEENSLQSLTGVFGQKFDTAGQSQWGESGLEIVPLGTDQQIFVQSVQSGSGALVFWLDEVSFGSATLGATYLDGDGQIDCPLFPVSSVPSSKSRLAASIASSGLAAIAWQDSRSGDSDIFIQNVNPDCSLGIQNQ
jgi:hypothetical protein